MNYMRAKISAKGEYFFPVQNWWQDRQFIEVSKKNDTFLRLQCSHFDAVFLGVSSCSASKDFAPLGNDTVVENLSLKLFFGYTSSSSETL